MKNPKFLLVSLPLLFFAGALTYAQTVPSGRAITLVDIINLAKDLGGFLMILGGVVAVIVIIVSGIMYLAAGSNQQRVIAAKGTLKAGIIGALIIFGAGAIISFIRGVAEDPFRFFT